MAYNYLEKDETQTRATSGTGPQEVVKEEPRRGALDRPGYFDIARERWVDWIFVVERWNPLSQKHEVGQGWLVVPPRRISSLGKVASWFEKWLPPFRQLPLPQGVLACDVVSHKPSQAEGVSSVLSSACERRGPTRPCTPTESLNQQRKNIPAK